MKPRNNIKQRDLYNRPSSSEEDIIFFDDEINFVKDSNKINKKKNSAALYETKSAATNDKKFNTR